jgi:tRNA-binding protein
MASSFALNVMFFTTPVYTRLVYTISVTPAPIKPLISIADLEKVDIRSGTIEAVDDVPGSDKLLALRVNFGDHKRTILSGMKQERANPQEIVGKQALFVVNLEPRKMRGMLSEGMLFDLGFADGVQPALAMPEHPVPDGTRAG